MLVVYYVIFCTVALGSSFHLQSSLCWCLMSILIHKSSTHCVNATKWSSGNQIAHGVIIKNFAVGLEDFT